MSVSRAAFPQPSRNAGKAERLETPACLMFTEYGVSKPWKFVRGSSRFRLPACAWHGDNGHCCCGGEGQSRFAYLPRRRRGQDIGSGRLVRVLEEWGGIERDVVAIYQDRRHLSAKVKLFVDFLEKRFRQRRPW